MLKTTASISKRKTKPSIESELSLTEKSAQLILLIVDFSELHAELSEGSEKEAVAKRLRYLDSELRKLCRVIASQNKRRDYSKFQN